jgi:hypothetical protein
MRTWTDVLGRSKTPATLSASLIGRLGSSTFRLSTNSSVDVAHGLALLFGLGTKALPSWDSKTRWNNLMGDLAVTITAGSSRDARFLDRDVESSKIGHAALLLLMLEAADADLVSPSA